MAKGYSIVPVNPRTGRVIQKPRKYQEVQVALQGPRGGIKLLRTKSQKYFKTDFNRLNSSIKNTESGNIILYEQKAPRIARDPKTGKKRYRIVDGKKVPILDTKLTAARPSKKQKPILFVKGKEKRSLDIGYKKGHTRMALTKQRLFLAKPNALKPISIQVKGPTIKSALAQLAVNTTIQDLKKATEGLFFTVIIQIQKPNGEIIRIPVSSSWNPKEQPVPGFSADRISYTNLPDGTRYPAMVQPLDRISNLQSKIAYSVRQALKSEGYRFTTLVQLNKIEERAYNVELPQLQERPDWTPEKEEAFENGINSLHWLDSYTHVSKLNQIPKRWKVTLFIRFELY